MVTPRKCRNGERERERERGENRGKGEGEKGNGSDGRWRVIEGRRGE